MSSRVTRKRVQSGFMLCWFYSWARSWWMPLFDLIMKSLFFREIQHVLLPVECVLGFNMLSIFWRGANMQSTQGKRPWHSLNNSQGRMQNISWSYWSHCLGTNVEGRFSPKVTTLLAKSPAWTKVWLYLKSGLQLWPNLVPGLQSSLDQSMNSAHSCLPDCQCG